MVCAERSASREVQLMPLCYYYVCFTLIPLAQGDYLLLYVVNNNPKVKSVTGDWCNNTQNSCQ